MDGWMESWTNTNNIGSIGQFYHFSCPGVVNGNGDCKEAILLCFLFLSRTLYIAF